MNTSSCPEINALNSVAILYREQLRYINRALGCKAYGRAYNKYLNKARECKQRALAIISTAQTFLENT